MAACSGCWMPLWLVAYPKSWRHSGKIQALVGFLSKRLREAAGESRLEYS